MKDEAPKGRPLVSYRRVEVPDHVAGLRLDRFLALRFPDRSRTELARGIRDGGVTDPSGRPMRASGRLAGGEVLHIHLAGLAADGPPPDFPPVLYEDDRLVIVDKPPGLTCHPGGTRFVWSLVSLARARWPESDLVHRLDRDTSGVVVLTKDVRANGFLKAAFRQGAPDKTYVALCRGVIPWDEAMLDAPIGRADGPIRIQMAARDDGLPACTEVSVLARSPDTTPPMTRVRCILHSGRTHQIRVHLAHAGYGLVGDRMYGVPPEVFLDYWETGLNEGIIARAGAPRHALHAATVRLPHPDGGELTVSAPLPPDMERWWAHPEVLPLDGWSAEPDAGKVPPELAD